MIIDNFGVFFDDTAAAASMTSRAVNFMPYAGREDPICISLLAKGANSAAASLVVHVQQSADGAAYTAAGSFTLSKPDAAAALMAIRLPAQVKEKYVRLAVEGSGSLAGVTLFAAVTRDCFAPYAAGLYIDKGQAVA